MYHVGSFHLRDMTACGAALRMLGTGAADFDVVADRLVRYLYHSFTTAQTGEPACVLVRLFKTTPYSHLTPDLQHLAVTRLGKCPHPATLPCLTLHASAGVVPEWNDPAQSKRFRVIPLGDTDHLAQLPMFSQLFHQLGVPLHRLREPADSVLLDSQEHLFNVFHILQAEGSPYIPAQDEFVRPYGVRSVLGFGAPLPNGDIFSVILFSKEVIPETTAQLFKPLALCAQIALAPHVERSPSPGRSGPLSGIKDADADNPAISQLTDRIAQLEKLLAVHEQTVNMQATRIETIVNGADIGTWEWDIPTGYVTFSHRWAGMLGYRLDDLEPHSRTWECLVHPDDKAAVMDALSAHLRGDAPHYSSEHRLRHKNGAWQWVFDSGRVLARDASGAPIRAAGILLDISARKALEEAAARAQQRLLEKQRALDEAQALAHLGSWEWNVVNGALHWSDEQYQIFGLDQAHIEPNYETFLAAIHADDRNRVREAVDTSLSDDAPYDLECRILRPSGEVRHIHCRGVVHRDVDGRPLSMAGTVVDVTDYKQTESDLRASEEKSRSVFESAIDGIIVMDDHGLIESVNPALLTLLGYEEREVVGQHVTMLMPSPSRERHDQVIIGDRGMVGSAREAQAMRKDGTVLDVYLSVSEMQIGSSRKYTGMLRDISERTRMDAALRESEERFRQLAEYIDAVFWLTSADKHEILYVSPGFETIWGRSRAALYADPSLRIDSVHPEDRERVGLAVACQSYLPYDEEYRIVTPSGGLRWIRDRGFPVKDQDGFVYRLAGISVDITAAKEMEAAVRGSEMRYRSLVELSPSAVFVNCDGRMVFANQACATLLGAATATELIGRHVLDFIHPGSHALVQERIAAMRATHRAAPSVDEQFYRLDGTVIEVEVTAAPVTFEGQEAFLVIVTDMTARKHLEQALLSTNTQLMGILSAARRLSIIAMDTSGIITTFNTGAEALLGYAAEEMIGIHSPTMLHLATEVDQRGQELSARYGRPIQGFDVLVEHVRQGGYDEREWTYVRKDGTQLIVLLTITALRNQEDAITGYLALGKDITQRKETEAALLKAARELERKNIELGRARDEALHAVRLKADFLATMSHEIRTPMNAIIGMTGLLLDTPLTPEQHECADTVRRSSDALLTLVNDILDFSKIEAGKLQFEYLVFDLRTTIEDALELFAEQAHSKGLELIGLVDAAVPLAVHGDPGRLRQILVNLVGNAIKFTGTGEVFLHVTRESGAGPHLLRFTITDTGIGIPEPVQAKLFQAFSQADSSTTRHYGGSGLGLAICRRLVSQMRGQIGVESRPGQGSTFWFTAQLPETALNAPPPRAQLRGQRLLLVDSNRTVGHVLHQQLMPYGIDCAAATNGPQACEMARAAAANQRPFDLALIELHLPDMDGFETARRLKDDPLLAAIRVVILTTVGRRGDGPTTQAVGIDAYLTKPLRHAQLLDCLCRLVSDAPAVRASEQVSTTSLITRPRPAEAHTSPVTRVLVAEDNPVNQKVASKMLEKLGCLVDVVANGKEAVAAHGRAPYPLIFMDCQMPEMDGFEATALIRTMEGASTHTPIVAMTANAMKGDRETCLAAGMDDYMAKPIRPKDLQTVLDVWLSKRDDTAA